MMINHCIKEKFERIDDKVWQTYHRYSANPWLSDMVMNSLKENFPSSIIWESLQSGRINISFNNDADEAHFISVIDNIET